MLVRCRSWLASARLRCEVSKCAPVSLSLQNDRPFMTQDTPAGSADDWFAQGNACAARGSFEEALVWFERARLARPFDARPYNNLGSTLVRLGRHAQALQCYSEAKALAPDDADVHHNLGWVLEQMRRLEEAIACYQSAVRLNPMLDGSYNNLGNCLHALGRSDEAHDAYRRAIDLAPETALYYRNFAQAKRLSPDDRHYIALERLIERVDRFAPGDQSQLHFAFAQALSDTGQHQQAFTHILRANALHRPSIQYNEAATLNLFRDLSAYVSQPVLSNRRNVGNPSDSPVFVIGMPRSGSTLIEQILASHPDVFGAGERPEFGQALVRALTPARDATNCIAVDALGDARPEQLAALGTDYLSRIEAAIPASRGFRRVVDKYPFNFMNVGLIHLALPNARFIHSRRAPVETCLSIFSRIFHDVPFGYDLGELGRYFHAYDALMSHWRDVLPEGVMLEVHYEKLVGDLEGTARRMIAHCGLDWDERCLQFHQTHRQVATASALQVRRPIYHTSLRRWRPDASVLEPLYDGLGARLCGQGH
jgi:tetratricopeptide (TPR) repeat protein